MRRKTTAIRPSRWTCKCAPTQSFIALAMVLGDPRAQGSGNQDGAAHHSAAEWHCGYHNLPSAILVLINILVCVRVGLIRASLAKGRFLVAKFCCFLWHTWPAAGG